MNVTLTHPKRTSLKSFWSHLWQTIRPVLHVLADWFSCFRSVHLAITLLALLCISTLVGVLMPQEGLVEVAEIKKTFGQSYHWLRAMGFFNVYSSHWFITFEVLFFFSLFFGSFQWLKPAFLAATRREFCGPEHILVSPNRFELASDFSDDETLARVSNVLKKHRYGVYQSSTHTDRLYACKGNLTRFGPVTAHFGILCLLIFSVYGTFYGFKAQKLAAPGTEFNLLQTEFWQPNIPHPFWQGSVPEWRVRVDDFRINYSTAPNADPGTVDQYYADLAILNPDGSVHKTETISVNHPLQMGDVTIYQAAFQPTGKFTLSMDGETLPLETTTQFENRPVAMHELDKENLLIAFPFFVSQQEPGVTEDHVVLFMKDGTGFAGAKPGEMPPTLRLRPGESGEFFGRHYKYIGPEIATGLQIKKAPEVPFVYLSFLIICVGAFMCIFSQRRIWIALKDQTVLVHFKTNKARLSFIKELRQLQSSLERNLKTS